MAVVFGWKAPVEKEPRFSSPCRSEWTEKYRNPLDAQRLCASEAYLARGLSSLRRPMEFDPACPLH